MKVRFLSRSEKPSKGLIRRPHPVWPEFADKMTWFSKIELQPNGSQGMYYCWVIGYENHQYEKPVKRKRFCTTYKGRVIIRPNAQPRRRNKSSLTVC